MDIVRERYEIAIERIKEISTENISNEKYQEYFSKVAKFILKLNSVKDEIESGRLKEYTTEQLEQLNYELYEDIYKENYETSLANPKFACEELGEEYGRILCYVYKKIRDLMGNVYRQELEIVTLRIELFIELFYYFENSEELEYRSIEEAVYSFEKDNTEIFVDDMVDWRVNPKRTFAVDIVMNSDLNDIRYLYMYGEHIGANEIGMAQYLNSLSQSEIDSLAHVYTEGYRKGFVIAGKDLSIKDTVDIRYNIGFERIIKSAILDFEKMGGLIPAIVQDYNTNKVLMLGFMNEEAYEETKATGKVTFFSRTKNRIWMKGETSGNTLQVVTIAADCDNDTLLIKAIPAGPVCHTGADTCFGEKNVEDIMFLKYLQNFIEQRRQEMPEGSYTTTLFQKGINRMAQKVGEEAVETVIEATNGTDDRLVYEAADMIYHLIVLLTSKGLRIEDLARELKSRHKG